VASAQRHLVTTTLDVTAVDQAARACRVHAGELVCTLVAEALRENCPGRPVPQRWRALVELPRGRQPTSRTYGNWTVPVALDLPAGPMPVSARATLIRDRLRRPDSGRRPAPDVVMEALGVLPFSLQGWVARRVHKSRSATVTVSYLPGDAEPRLLAGATVRGAVPVVPLAEGVPVAVAAMRWADDLGVGVLLDASSAGTGDRLVTTLHAALDRVLREARDGATGSAAPAPATCIVPGIR
jgi:hypothetical protein